MRSLQSFLRPVAVWVMLVWAGSVRSGDFSRFEGLAGRELAEAVRAEYAPPHLLSALPVGDVYPSDWPQGWWPSLRMDGGSRIALLVPEAWSGTPILDMYNMVGANDRFVLLHYDYPPGNVEKVTDKGDGWTTGTITLDGAETNAWQPAEGIRGDVARRIMYVALMYPRPLWEGRASMFMADGEWPLLNTYARELLSEWSASDPVDELEQNESSLIASLQGNENPFITFPGLADYLWGDEAGQGYVPDEKRERQPLRGVYSREADRFIDLYSPYVGDGVAWQFDGKTVDGESIELADVALGEHIISYATAGAHGKLKINVIP